MRDPYWMPPIGLVSACDGSRVAGKGNWWGARRPLLHCIRSFHTCFVPFTTEIQTFPYDLHENNAAEITEAILANRMAFGIIRAPVIRTPALSFINLGVERLIAALPCDHNLPLRKDRDGAPKVRVGALADQNFILVRRRTAPGMYANILEACRLCGFEPRVIAEVDRMLTNLNLVAAGIGISFVPKSMQCLTLEGVILAGLEAPDRAQKLLHAPLTLVHHAEEARPLVLAFLAEARRLIGRRTTSPIRGLTQPLIRR
jgi:DNA-binding transcriptional LysR family regulator